jgi:branched-chain amino acid transport system permease protein
MLIALDSGLTSTMVIIGLKAFPAALVGGLDSLLGALAGAVIVAAAEILLIHYVDPLLSDVVPFLVLVAMLVVRPWGLFGTREELDRV